MTECDKTAETSSTCCKETGSGIEAVKIASPDQATGCTGAGVVSSESSGRVGQSLTSDCALSNAAKALHRAETTTVPQEVAMHLSVAAEWRQIAQLLHRH